MKQFILVLFILFLGNECDAQGGVNGQGRSTGLKGKRISISGEVLGKVVDYQTGEPLQYTNVALYSKRDSTLIT
ncbi:MAG: hypothetical protein ACJAWO_002383, partial [Halieaceae bacterium]